ncbi:MAG: sugar ABC transporter ATP-binding protein [Eubacterium sp.]|nr:sugar ABC transporter ATP-binding protein [Eubacterium sp.]
MTAGLNKDKSYKEKPILSIRGLTKVFPGVKALDQVDFDLYPGEVHILVGENGAGKSTLSKCLLGVYQPDEGEIFYDGQPVRFSSPRDALQAGIAAVYQELTMIPWLTAPQNIFFNREPRIKGTPLIDKKKMTEDCRALLEGLHSSAINLSVPVKKLGVAEQQMLEIAKALSFHPRVLILDEPTATLSAQETDSLFARIESLTEAGIGIIYISHRMSEYRRIGDRITVLRDGKKVSTEKNGNLTEDQLIHLMVGRSLSQIYQKSPNTFSGEVLRVEGLSDRAGKVKNCSLTLKKGEIVGLSGLVGSGRTELARLIYGIDRPAAGRVILHGRDMTRSSPKAKVDAGLGFLPEDRKLSGLTIKAPIDWNVVAASLSKYFPHLYLSERKNEAIARDYVDELKIKTPDVHRQTEDLSGGNQQKVVIAKWLASDTDILIFDEPTRGIDIGARMEIYRLMDALTAEGKSILMISSDLSEVISMSDRLYVMREGQIISEMQKDEFSMERIGQLMLADRSNNQ